MRLFDQTPFQNKNGEISFFNRLQGILQYGPSWYAEVQAQKTVITHLERGLPKGFVLIQNHTLESSDIVLPLVLIGPPGIVLAYATHLRGTYLAKGDSWSVLRGNNFRPAAINLLSRTERLARALSVFLKRQGAKRSLNVEPVILAANPGLYVETQRPSVRIVLSDGLERWANSLAQGNPLLPPEVVEQLADRILNPRPPRKEEQPEENLSQSEDQAETPEPFIKEDAELSRSQAIFKASEEAEPIDPEEISFAFDDSEGVPISRDLVETSPAVPLMQDGEKKRILGMTIPQLTILGVLLLVEIFVFLGFAIIYYLYF